MSQFSKKSFTQSFSDMIRGFDAASSVTADDGKKDVTITEKLSSKNLAGFFVDNKLSEKLKLNPVIHRRFVEEGIAKRRSHKAAFKKKIKIKKLRRLWAKHSASAVLDNTIILVAFFYGSILISSLLIFTVKTGKLNSAILFLKQMFNLLPKWY